MLSSSIGGSGSRGEEECTQPTVPAFIAHGCVQGQLLVGQFRMMGTLVRSKVVVVLYPPSAAFKQEGLDSARVIGTGLQSPLVVIFIPSL